MTEPLVDHPIDAATPTPTACGGRATAEGAPVPCIYCRAPIPADAFTYWSAAKRLLSGPCPHCHRRVTLTAVTWRRWSARSGRTAS